jgi:hypothetical protein
MACQAAVSGSGGFTLISSLANEGWPARYLGALVLVGLTMMASGCGSSEVTQQGTVPKAALKEEDLYKYIGEGAAKKKVGLTIDERRRARGAAKAQGSN